MIGIVKREFQPLQAPYVLFVFYIFGQPKVISYHCPDKAGSGGKIQNEFWAFKPNNIGLAARSSNLKFANVWVCQHDLIYKLIPQFAVIFKGSRYL